MAFLFDRVTMDTEATTSAHPQRRHKRTWDHGTQTSNEALDASTPSKGHHHDQAHPHNEPTPASRGESSPCKRLCVTNCPWTDSLQVHTVWGLVADHVLARAQALDSSSFGGGADKGHLRAARTLLNVGSTCRALYAFISALCVRVDALVGIEDDTDKKRLLWCAVVRTDVAPRRAVFDTDHSVYHSLLHTERLVMRSSRLCGRDLARPIKCSSVASDAIHPSDLDGYDTVQPTEVIAEAMSCEGDVDNGCAGDDQKENDDKRGDARDKEECESDEEEEDESEDEDDDEQECESDDSSDEDEDDCGRGEDDVRSFKSTIGIPEYQELWDLVKWPGAENLRGGDKDGEDMEDFEDYGDTHEEEEGTLLQADCKGRNWTLTIYSHYHHGLTLVDVQIVPRRGSSQSP
ncbi:hypothetical protein pneo_cds_955 [Pandoravirus neocaledonia]|uniref:Uncharacterized protein n=1 Tax=Pandoravirus neocaledonia TaxID=2107708 RepID=A0A2U7UDS0_9VIRU|nr:hypothetical protein pneo_cds_955 [Pandoravirus neocaledonia]AVK76562.1 hypothetical protein pneo_cds_955 [Pandoravirus neocaledonia]